MMLLALSLAAFAAVPEDAGPDRSAPPKVEPAALITLPTPEVHAVRPGLNVWMLPGKGLKDVQILCAFRRGSHTLGSRQHVELFGWVWDQATRSMSADEVEVFEDLHDIDVSSSAGMRQVSLSLSGPVERWTEGLPLLESVLYTPRFQRSDLKKIREAQHRWLLEQAPGSASAIVGAAHDFQWFPIGHVFRSRPEVQLTDRVRPAHLHQVHQRLLAEAPLDVLVVGDVPWTQIERELLPVLRDVGQDGAVDMEPIPFTPPSQGSVIAVDQRGASRVSLALRMAAPRTMDEDYLPFILINHALGGSFLSRLNRELREERGLTYGIDASYTGSRSLGHVDVQTEVAAENAGEVLGAVEAIFSELAREGATSSELAQGAAAAVSSWNNTYSTASRVSGRYWSWLMVGRDVDSARTRALRLSEITPAQSQEVAERWLGPDAPRLWVLVGDRDVLEPQLEALNLKVRWLPSPYVVMGFGLEPPVP
ncbi:MAG: M16 family metallopeptidase [Myxococcota bacterium]